VSTTILPATYGPPISARVDSCAANGTVTMIIAHGCRIDVGGAGETEAQIAGCLAGAFGRARADHDVAARLCKPARDCCPQLTRAAHHSDFHAFTHEARVASRPARRNGVCTTDASGAARYDARR
jgi:hypothetical protein